jgi:hypothetical protein
MRPIVLPVFCFCAPDSLQDIHLLGAGEVHHDLSVVGPQSEGRVIFCLNRGRSFVDLTKPEDIIDSGIEPETREDLLLLGRGDLNELTSNFDDYLNFALGFGQPRDGLEDITCVCNYADGLLGKMKLAEVEMCLEILEAADQMVFHILWVENTAVALSGDAEEAAKTFTTLVKIGSCAGREGNNAPKSTIHVIHVNS